MNELIAYMAKGLVDRPDQVEIRSTPAEGGVLYELKVAAEDVGKVIGRDGRTINAMRTLVSVAAQRKGERARLELLDDRRSQAANGATEPATAAPPDADGADA